MKTLPGAGRVVRSPKNTGYSAPRATTVGTSTIRDLVLGHAARVRRRAPWIRGNVEAMMRVCVNSQVCALGRLQAAHEPIFIQGHGRRCLPYVFRLAGKYDIKWVAKSL
jgi:hypothetical protein